ncbi:MAG TPA: hypothetical protein ENH13_05390, partial [Euryarchaeota archaeon]|nr:hypothetical protein [Euryarchaeota archaeon]
MKYGYLVLLVLIIAASGCIGEKVQISNWPSGYDVAAVITFDVEQAQTTDIIRTVDLLEKYDAKATFFVVAGYYEGAEEILKPLHQFEVGNKGWDQSTWPADYEGQRKSIKRAHTMLTKQGFNPRGFRAPYLKSSPETLAALSDLKYSYSASETGLLPTVEEGVVKLPLSVSYDPFWNDDVKDYLPLFYMAFEKTLDAGGVFTFYTMPENVDSRWEAFLKHLQSRNVWVATGSEVSDWWKLRSQLSLKIVGDTAVVTNNGESSVSGATLTTKKGFIPLPKIAPGE